jgi:Flp pilus assembly protein CpaB
MRSRMVTLMLAVLTGAVAVAIVYLYVQRVEDESARGLEVREVLVAGQGIPAGTRWDEIFASGLTRTENIPEKYVVSGALGSASDLPARSVLAREVVAGEQLTSQAFAANQQTAFGYQFEAGTQALSLPVERVRAVAGHVAPGSRLNAFESTDQGGTKPIARRIEVVEIQPAAEGDPAGLDEMVLQVTEDQALALINAQEQASLWFTLIPPRSSS